MREFMNYIWDTAKSDNAPIKVCTVYGLSGAAWLCLIAFRYSSDPMLKAATASVIAIAAMVALSFLIYVAAYARDPAAARGSLTD